MFRTIIFLITLLLQYFPPPSGSVPYQAVVGEFYTTNNSTPISLPTQNVFVQITGMTCGHTASVTCASSALTLTKSLKYEFNFGAQIIVSANQSYLFAVFVNGIQTTNATAAITRGSQTSLTIAVTGVDPLNNGDVVDVRVECTSGNNTSVTVASGNFNISSAGS